MWRREPRARPIRPETVGVPVIRKVDSSGNVSFAVTAYRVGNAMRGRQVQVRVVGDTVEISIDGRVIDVHADSLCLHGDTPGAVEMARAVRSGLEHAGVEVVPLGQLV